MRRQRIERTRIQEFHKAFRPIHSEAHRGKLRWALLPSRRITKHQPRAGIADDEFDNGVGKAIVDRDSDQSRAHDAVISDDELRPVDGQDRDSIAPAKSAGRQGARDAPGHAIDLRVSEAPLTLPTEINDRKLPLVAVAANEIAEIDESGHHAFG